MRPIMVMQWSSNVLVTSCILPYRDGDVKKYLNSSDCEPQEKIVHIPKVPEDWEPGLVLALYSDGFTLALLPNTELPSDKIAYDESGFLR